MTDVVGVGEVEAFFNLEVFEGLDKRGFFFLVVRGRVTHVDGPRLKEGLDHEVFHLIDLVAADGGYLRLLCDEDDVITFEELDEAHNAVGLPDDDVDALDLADVVVKLVTIEDSGLLLHDVSQCHGAVCVWLLEYLHSEKLTLYLVGANEQVELRVSKEWHLHP